MSTIFTSSFFKSSIECKTDWTKIRLNVRPDLGPSYLQRLSVDKTKIVGKELTNMSIVSFLWDIDESDATECVVSTIKVQTVLIQIRPDLTSGLIWIKHVCAKINSRWQLTNTSLLSFGGDRQTV